VVSKSARKRKNRAAKKAAAGNPPTQAKRTNALERAKAAAPAKAFVVKTGESDAGKARAQLWSDLLKKVGAPQIRSTTVLPRGDLLIKPGNEATFRALKDLEGSGSSVRQDRARWPKVLIYDVDRVETRESIPGLLAEQNPTLGLTRENSAEAILPLFRRGPKTGDSVWWVCSVSPDTYRKLVGRRVYLGMSCCRVVEYSDVVRCFKCQRFGHIASGCKSDKDVCGRCAGNHRTAECKVETRKCTNCGSANSAGHKGCISRMRAEISSARRTDFGVLPSK